MKKTKEKIYIVGIIACLLVSAVMIKQMIDTLARSANYYPEPDTRPDIRSDAVWDSELGMYVSQDLVKNADGEYEINPDVFIDDDCYDPEGEWNIAHMDSMDEVDRAIALSVQLSILHMNDTPEKRLSSCPDAMSDEDILFAMRRIPVEFYPQIWERICLERAYRPQKIVALLKFTGITTRWGLYDQWAQKQWYMEFNLLRSEIKELRNTHITEEDEEKYGNMLLPILFIKTQKTNLSADEIVILENRINNVEAWLYPEKGETVKRFR